MVSRIGDGDVLSIGPVTGSGSSSFTSSNDPVGGLANGDLSLIFVRSQTNGSGGTAVVGADTGPGEWTSDATTPADLGTLGASVKNSYLLSRIHDGTATDMPEVEYSGTGTKNFSAHRCAYRGGANWSVLDEGSIEATGGTDFGSIHVGGTSVATSRTLTLASGYRGLIIAYAVSASPDTMPTIHTANGFTEQYSNDDPSNTTTMPILITDYHFTTSGTYALPRFNVDQGNSSSEHHVAWVAYVYSPNSGFTLGRLRFGSPGGGFS